jgi:outer membrane immunogenic protein
MKKIVLGALALATVPAGWAAAADMPLKAPAMAAPVADPWTGYYVGGNAGYSWGNWANSSGNANFPSAAGFTTTANPNVKGWVAGGQFGANKLIGRWLVGFEADIQWTGQHADMNGTTTTVIPGIATFSLTELNRWELPWFATARGRVGVTVADTWLLYVTGGAAMGRAQYNHTSTATLTAGPVTATASFVNSEGITRAGAAVGGGIEKAIDAHWRAKAEFLYLDFGTYTFLSGTGFDDVIRTRDYIARVGFNYRFTPN